MSDKNTVILGKPPETNTSRDAIHIAVVAVVAGDELRPGEHVFLDAGGAALRYVVTGNPIGIVDPFLRRPVNKGEMFWLCLYQGSITSLRHVWTHPEVDCVLSDVPPPKCVAPASERWLRAFARDHWGGLYEDMMASAAGGTLCFGDTDYPEDQNAEFWAHFNAVTQKDTQGYFRCAC